MFTAPSSANKEHYCVTLSRNPSSNSPSIWAWPHTVHGLLKCPNFKILCITPKRCLTRSRKNKYKGEVCDWWQLREESKVKESEGRARRVAQPQQHGNQLKKNLDCLPSTTGYSWSEWFGKKTQRIARDCANRICRPDTFPCPIGHDSADMSLFLCVCVCVCVDVDV